MIDLNRKMCTFTLELKISMKNIKIKGCVMKKLYPSPNMRSMCDIDILIEDDGIDRAEKIMQNLGYHQ